jgi:hypothetical protein
VACIHGDLVISFTCESTRSYTYRSAYSRTQGNEKFELLSNFIPKSSMGKPYKTHNHSFWAIFYFVLNLCSCLTLSLLMSYIYEAPCKARNFNVLCIWNYVWPSLSIYCTMFQHWINAESFSVSVVCKHFAIYQGYPNYRWDLIRYAKG